ncbi:hypothetical protein PHAVU_003G138356, partial [Phaseolus vulgaris]
EKVVVPAEPATSIPGEAMEIMTAFQLVLKKSLAFGSLTRGLHEAAKVIKKHVAQLCAICVEHNVSLFIVPSAKTLGEWAGLCKIDSEEKAR